MSTSPTDALWAHLYCLFDRQLQSPAPKTFCSLALKLAFIIHTARGIDVNPATISMPIINLYNDMDDVVGRKASLIEYEAPGRIGIILEVRVGAGENIITALQEKVDKAVEAIMRDQGSSDLPTYQEAQGGEEREWAE